MDSELVQYVGHEIVNTDYHHGGLRPAVGTHNIQVLRANRSHPAWADGFGWTYNHAPMLAYWQGRFYLEYLSTPFSEHDFPGQTLLTASSDGLHWDPPRVLFPPHPSVREALMHQRMGFYVSPQGRLLALGFYGLWPHPNDGRGIGRVVREIYPDGAFGPIYFLRYNRHAGWHEGNAGFAPYTASPDEGFKTACAALLADRLVTLQWWEEDRSPDGFYAVEGQKALSYYHLSDGRVVGLWKWSKAAISADEGRTWSPVRDVPSLVMAGAKVWGQRTSDGRYALVYNPTPDNNHRWPLAVVTGDDGLHFDHMLSVHGEVPPRRFKGKYKDYGPQYVRGIVEGNGCPPDGALWVTYSVNKEDIWVSRVPVPIRDWVDAPVNDTFEDLAPGGFIPQWNIYSPLWAPVAVETLAGEKTLMLTDRDPYDYAKAERVFPASIWVTVHCQLLARQNDTGQLYLELVDAAGSEALRLILDGDGWLKAQNGGTLQGIRQYAPDTWYTLSIATDLVTHRYDLALNGATVLQGAYYAKPVQAVERLVLRTGPRRRAPTLDTTVGEGEDLPRADEPGERAVYHLRQVRTEHR